ncbi:MAG: hypothetical protein AAFN68_06210 [Pseudomonadota bacterium]
MAAQNGLSIIFSAHTRGITSIHAGHSSNNQKDREHYVNNSENDN